MLRESQLFEGSGLPLRVIEHITRGVFPRASVEAICILFTLSGVSEAVSDSETVPLGPGSILFVPSGLVHKVVPRTCTRIVTFYLRQDYVVEQLRWLGREHPLISQLHHSIATPDRMRGLHIPREAMRRLAPNLVRLGRLPDSQDTELSRLALTLAAFATAGEFSNSRSDRSFSLPSNVGTVRGEVLRAISLMEDCLECPWTIGTLAGHVALSTSQLSRLFRIQLGSSPAAYLRCLRAERMAELLVSTTDTVAAAGRTVGWKNPAMASRSFRIRYGLSPSKFRLDSLGNAESILCEHHGP